jgi:hypothetical protein
MALEAARQRRDARTRSLQMDVIGQAQLLLYQRDDAPTPLADGHEFHLPRDGGKRIIVRQTLHLSVADGGRMWISVSPNLDVGGLLQNGDRWLIMPGQQSIATVFDTERSVAQWVSITEARVSGGADDYDIGFIGVADPYDDGTIDAYELWKVGTPMVKVADREGIWLATMQSDTQYPRVATDVRPVRRMYYVSKSENELLS